MQSSPLKLVIIEDEQHVRENLQMLLARDFPDIELLGMADGVQNGIQLVRKFHPDVVLLDIQLPDGSGFELADHLCDTDIWIIFMTAHSEFALKAFNYLSLDYLLKPVQPLDLRKAFGKIHKVNSFSSAQLHEAIRMVGQQKLDRIALSDATSIQFVRLDEIEHCQAWQNYTEFHLRDRPRITVTKTLKHFEKMLAGENFMRIHQKYLINLTHIQSFHTDEGYYVRMESGTRLEVSRRKKAELLAWISAQ